MRKLFTFLVAFLATVSGAVWGQGSASSPVELGESSPTLEINNSSETWYITTKPGETNTAGIRIDGGSPTIHLIDVNMSAGGSSIVLEGYTTATFVLEGISSITSQNGTDAAIKVGINSQLNISIESTGILTINTPNFNNYAIGGSGGITSVGSGTVYFDGGTIMTNGIIGDFEWHGMRLNNSAVLIANAVTGSRGNTSGLENGGVKFIGGTTAGEIVDAATEFTLNSPVPDGYSINMKNKPFTAGKGAVINKNMVLNASQINAYQISYDPNYQEGDAGGSTQQSINYFGPSTTVRNILDLECKGNPQTHQFLGWVDSDGTIHTNQTYTTSSAAPSGEQTLSLTGGWIDWNRVITVTSAGFQTTNLLLTPNNAKASFGVNTSSSLPQNIQFSQGTRELSGTWNETEDKETTFDVKINDGTDVYKTVKVTFDYAANITITGAKVKDNVTYAGAPLKEAIEVTAVDGENNPVPVVLGVHYTISEYTYNKRISGTSVANPTDDPNTGKVIQQAGTYTRIKIAAKPGSGVTLGFNGQVTDPLTVNPYPIDINVPTNQTALEGEPIEIKYSLPTVHDKTPKTNDGTLALEGNSTAPGTHNIVIGTLKLVDDAQSGFYVNNYVLNDDNLGTFLIKENIGKEENGYAITVSDAEVEYDGKNHASNITLTKNGNPVEISKYSISFSTEAGSVAEVVNAGTYKVTVKGIGELGGTLTTENAIKITPREVTIKAADQTIKIGEQPELNAANHTAEKPVIEIDRLVPGETPSFEGSLNLASEANVNIARPYTNALSISSLTVKDNVDGKFLASNYLITNAGNYGKGTLTVTDDSGIDIEIPTGGEVTVDGNGNYSFPYDGKNHNDFFKAEGVKVKVTYTDGEEKTVELTKDDFKVTYQKDGSDFTSLNPWNVGTYVATITVTKEDPAAIKGKSTVRTITVTKRSLSATIKPQTIETADASIKTEVNGNVTIVNPVKTETAVLTGSLKVKDGLTLQAGHIYKGAIVKDNFTLADGTDQNGFKAANYELKDEKITAGDLTVKQATNPTDPEDIIPGDGDNDWTWDPTQNAYTMTYDGLEHGITQLKVKFTDSENNVSYQVVKVTATYQPNVTPKEYVDGGYTATVSIPENEYIKNGTASLKLMILKRDMTLDFHLPQSLTEGETPNWNAKTAITFTNLANPKGKEETPTIKDECRLVIENGKAVLKGYPYIVDNAATGFKMNNYTVDYKNNGQDITIDPDGDGDVEIPEIPVNPDEGGDGGDGQDPTKYYNIYDVTEYDFINVSFSRNVVREGGSVNVYLEIPEGLDPAAVTLMFKRGMYNNWETLDEGVQPGEYPINNIWSDIYVKAVVDESYIDPNPDENHIYIDLSETNDSIWLYTERKLVEEGKTAVIQAEVAKSCQNKEIRYMYKRTVLGEWKEMPKDYSINQYVVRDITTDIYVKAYFVFDKQDPTTAKNPHHVYADITATCEGLYLDATRHKVADEGDTKVFLYVKKGFETKDARYLFKRGLKGEWEDLVPGIEQNTFQVTDIEGDIYLKGMDAVYTGTEDIDGMVRVYTKDGSLFVYTAQPEEISVVSMTGVTVKRTRQTGLQSYPLNQGIYVVCVGEQVFKVRVK